MRSRRERVFVFKQKTAYEVLAWLEFRRVLFPISHRASLPAPRTRTRPSVGSRTVRRVIDHLHAGEEARRIAEAGTLLRTQVGSGVHGTAISGQDDRDELGICLEPRSEERRVGKECRSRWS